ncbi:hypothetical protein ITP53_55560, partial [Nonomuraea sp. K274]|nr:hypothetical protein [Nonomuraea cypriaca]
EGAPKQAREIEQAINGDTDVARPTPTPSKPPTPVAEPRPDSPVDSIVVWGVVLAGVLGAYLLAVIVVPPLRRARRRRAASPAVRVTGAWRQTVARLRGAGLPVGSGALTAREVALLGESVLGTPAREPLTALADLANLATFGAAAMDQGDADLAWRHFAGVDLLVRQKIGLTSRIARRLSPTSLFT